MEHSASVNPAAHTRKSQHLWACFLPLSLFVILALSLYGGGLWLAVPIIYLMVIIPLLDLLTGWQDSGHYEASDFTPVQITLLHWNTRLYALLYMGFLIYLAFRVEQFTALELGLLIGDMGLIGGLGFGASHELLHGKDKLDQIIQKIATAFLFYPHYKLIHIRSHHIHAGTDHDENTAWMNESIYSYIVRTIPGSAIRCWMLEVRLARASGTSFWRNKMVAYAAGQVAILLGFYLLTGWLGLLFYIAHVLVAHIVLESVNYIQHYGLMREKKEGEYEKTGAEHSWDTYHYFSSYITFRVGHHSYHHIAVKPYYLLETEEEAPKLPVGYFWAIPVVFVPPVWRSLANPRIEASPSAIA